MSDEQRVYTVVETAERLGVTVRAVQEWVRKGRFPHAYKLDPFGLRSPFMIPEEDIRAFEEARKNYFRKKKGESQH